MQQQQQSSSLAKVLCLSLLLLVAPVMGADAQPAQHVPPANAVEDSGPPPGVAQCGQEGMPVCPDECFIKEMGHPDWCPAPLTEEGCLLNLTRISITPTAPREEVMQDVCMALPEAGRDCGLAGTPCCINPSAYNPSTLVRPQCQSNLSCMISDPVTSLPYGGTQHMAAVLRWPRSRGLLAPQLMGTCRIAAPLHEATSPPAAASSSRAAASVLGECGTGKLRCPNGTYCASNEDHLLGGARCVPMPYPCGAPNQPCCPPFSNGAPPVHSIVDKRTAVPTCSDPGSVCVWKSALPSFDPSKNSEAVQLLSPPASTSINAQYPNTLCLPNMDQCGSKGQPCCPHAQFASSNSPMFFRLHTCDHGLRCNATISLFQRSGRQPKPVVLGVCTGAEEPCGGLGERCCSHTDQAGWTWRVCGDGEPGVFCGADNVCARCPSTTTAEAGMSQAALAAMSLPGVGNTC